MPLLKCPLCKNKWWHGTTGNSVKVKCPNPWCRHNFYPLGTPLPISVEVFDEEEERDELH